MPELKCNADRLWSAIMSLAEIGATPGGGVGRIALTETDREARDRFVQWSEAAGCEVRVDAMGNIFARRAGTQADTPAVMTGSHLDTQPLGGKFDGIFGVLAGLEAVRALNDANVRTRAPLDVAVWTDEEGVRFAGGCVASGVFAGVYELEYGLNLADSEGVTLGEALARIGYAGDEPVGGYPVDSFFEAHIEQGPILEAEGLQVGVVLGAQGQLCFEVVVSGEEGHAGTLPMGLRKDAMVGAARMIAALNDLAFTYEPHPVITVGHVRVRPNSRNTIPGQVVFTIDARHPDDDTLELVAADMHSTCRGIAEGG
ncbi:MAG: hydantoinase/carbamoylase family amidase, partial [Gammaproteobacteria bacterium]